MADMFDRLRSAEERFEQLNELLMDPAVVTDQNRYRDLMKEHKQLTPIVEKYREHMAARQERDEAKAMLDEGGLDKDFKEMVLEQLDESGKKLEQTSEELRILLLPQDPNDDKNVIIEIRGGAGGDEAALFANTLYRMYSMYAEQKGWKSEIMYASETELGGFKEISFAINGDGAYSRLKFESGVHRVQRVPETEAAGRIHTSTVTVAVLPEAEEVDVDINPTDLQIDTYRSGGAGGQHVNKTESAIRITHLPTGIVVACQNERSQHQNREVAMKMLLSKLMKIKEQENFERIEDIKGDQKEIGWGSQIRSYVFMPYTMVKDHRTGFEVGNVGAVMDGDLDGFINAYLTAASLGKLAK